MDWIQLAKDGDQWRAPLNTVTDLPCSTKVRICLAEGSISFSGTILHHVKLSWK